MRLGDVVAQRFVIEAVAGEGGMGIVYKARDRELGVPVALKVLRGEEDEQFTREAQLLSHLVHPGIVRCIAFGRTDEGRPFLATEWLEGETVRQRIARPPPLTVAECLSIARRTAEALAAAHAWGVVHRDVTPANIVLLADGQLKLLDFGIARVGPRAIKTETSAGLGTPGYLAPEQARGDDRVDARADVFSLGCVLFECLTGRKAFEGDHAVAVLARVLIEDAPRVRALRRDVPTTVDALVARMLSREPSGRPQDGAAVAARIAELDADLALTPQPIAALPSRPQIGASEARVTTVVVASKLDPAMRSAIDARLSGHARVDWLTPTSLVVSVAGEAPRATEQAVRAANAARELRSMFPSARIAIATGRSRPLMTQRVSGDWIGDAVGRAVELSRTDSATAHVVVDDPTAGLLADRFAVERVGDVLALGASAPTTRTLLGREVPCVGRDREIDVVMTTWDECVSEPIARVVLLSGAPGIGKSRIREEVTRRIREAVGLDAIWFARGDAGAAAAPLGVVTRLVASAIGASLEEPAPAKRARLARAVARHVTSADAPRVIEFLGEVVAGGHGEAASVQLRAARQDPMLMGDQVRRAWEDFVCGVLATHPVVLVVEDMQWADAASVRAVDALLGRARELPLLVIGVGRPEMKEAFPRVWGAREPLELALGRLAPRALERLARVALGEQVSDERVKDLVERSSGNPFFLEELVRAVATGSAALPESVLAMVQARLDALEPEARRVLRAASFFGQGVTAEAVAALAGDERGTTHVEPWLAWLVEREFLARRDARYDFRHTLLREAAYATLTDEDRSLGHLLAARFLEAQGHRDAAALATHYERGGARADAARWWLAAAVQALEVSDLANVVAHAERALEDAASAERGYAQLLLAEARRWRGEYTLAAEAARLAMDALPARSPRWYQAAAEAATVAASVGDAPTLAALGAEVAAGDAFDDTAIARAVARVALQLVAAGDPSHADALLERVAAVRVSEDAPLTEARVQQALALRARVRCDVGEVAERTLRCLDAFERAGDARNACNQRMTLGFALLELGQTEEGARHVAEGLALAERLGLASAAAVGRHMQAMVALREGDAAKAADIEEGVRDFFALHKSARYEGGAWTWIAQARLELGDVAAAHEAATRAVDLLANVPPARAGALAVLASVALARGEVTAALAAAEEAVDLADRPAGVDSGDALARLVRARALAAAGRGEEAEAAARLARERLLARADRIARPEWRRSFLERVPENARTLAWPGAPRG